MKTHEVVFIVDEQRYPLVFSETEGGGLTPREHGELRRVTGIVGLAALFDALAKGDLEVQACLAVVAMRRAGASPSVDRIMDGVSSLSIEFPEAEAVAGPPVVAVAARPSAA